VGVNVRVLVYVTVIALSGILVIFQ